MKSKIFIIILILLIAFTITGCIENTSKGSHYGIITAKEKNIFGAWDVYVKTSVQSTQEDKYCVLDESIIPSIEEAGKSGNRITIHYKDDVIRNIKCTENVVAVMTGIEE